MSISDLATTMLLCGTKGLEQLSSNFPPFDTNFHSEISFIIWGKSEIPQLEISFIIWGKLADLCKRLAWNVSMELVASTCNSDLAYFQGVTIDDDDDDFDD